MVTQPYNPDRNIGVKEDWNNLEVEVIRVDDNTRSWNSKIAHPTLLEALYIHRMDF